MKKWHLLILAIISLGKISWAQLPALEGDKYLLWKAKQKLNHKHPSFNPAEAHAELAKLSEKGNAEAMNDLGMLYMQGWGTEQNDKIAIEWFKKAAYNGYGKAWYNWGTMYKNGDGTLQDFKKAYEIFQSGADRGFSSSLYALGYMLYHGLGCEQNYPKAIDVFRLAAAKKNYSAMYMLGLCYRNGYGIAVNIDSARNWLEKATNGGYKIAKEELLSVKPENNAVTDVINVGVPKKSSSQVYNTPQEYSNIPLPPKTKHQLAVSDLSGEYEGFILRYDWSGQHIIGRSKLLVTFEQNGKHLKGKWIEADTLYTVINADLTDSAIVFNQTNYKRINHYSPVKPLLYEFRDAKLQVLGVEGQLLTLAGNVTLWNVQQREPENPVYISLTKKATLPVEVINGEQLPIFKNLAIYPNPFNQQFTVEFNLEKQSHVNIELSDVNGKILYKRNVLLGPGFQNQQISVNVPGGIYVLSLNDGNHTTSRVVIKQ